MRPGNRLVGTVDVPGAKNSVLKLMAACLMADGDYVLTNVPGIDDVTTMANLLGAIDRKSTRLNFSHVSESRMPSSA